MRRKTKSRLVTTGLTSAGLAAGSLGGFQFGVSSVDQVVIVRPPLESAELKGQVSKTKLTEQLEAAGVEVIFDDIQYLPSDTD